MINALAKLVPSSINRFLDQRSSLRKIISNAGWLFADSVAANLAGFFVGAWVARYLGPTQYGTLNTALAVVALFTPLVALGLKDIVIRDIVRSPNEKEEILGSTFGLQLVAGAISIGITIGIAQITRPQDPLSRWLMVILATQFVFQVFSITLGYWFNSQVQAKYIVWANNIALLLYCLVRVVLVLNKAPLITFAWAALGQAGVYATAIFVFYKVSGEKLFSWQLKFTRAKKLLANSWPLLISSLAIMVYLKIGQVMLGNMVDEKTLGIYSAAIRLSEVWYFIPVAISTSVFPALVRSSKNDSEEIHTRRMQLFFDVMTAIAYAIVVPIVIFGPWLVKAIFGSSYIAAGPMLRAHACALLFVFLGTARSRWLIAEDLVRFNMLVTILGALTNIAVNFALIPRFGGLGAALAVVISQAVSTYLSSILSKRLWPVFRQQSLALLIPFRIIPFIKSISNFLKLTD